MDIIYIIKALMIGCMGAGGFYFIMSLLLHYFPLPFLIKTQNLIDTWAIKHCKTDKALERVWTIGKRMAKFTIVMICLSVFGVFTYLLYNVLSFYLPIDNKSPLFISYYLIAIALPLSWILLKIIKYFWGKKKKNEPSPPVEEPPRKTLLEQMVEE
jgi:hypothetical protein